MEELQDFIKPEKSHFAALVKVFGRSALEEIVVRAGLPAETPYPEAAGNGDVQLIACLLYTSPSPRDRQKSRMPSSA